tara:strand:+ start:467 stop:586 length:120 start_codon:yes stop_codon:yes gene_type:complete
LDPVDASAISTPRITLVALVDSHFHHQNLKNPSKEINLK